MSYVIKEYAQLLSVLHRMVDLKKTGTLFIRSNQNRLAVVAIEDGVINFISYGAKRGLAAIPLIRDIEAGTFQITKTADTFDPCDLPETDEVLQLLGEETEIINEVMQDIALTTTISGGEFFNSRATLKSLCGLLENYLGPIASMLCEERLEGLGPQVDILDLQRIIKELAEEIGDAQEAREFTSLAFDAFPTLSASTENRIGP